jgi:RimJ/RimL family protein N-acetyltransferase
VKERDEQHRVGGAYLETVTTLLQRRRSAHPMKGSYEAAELQWWWTIERPTDQLAQLFWFDESGVPEAAVIVADFSDGTSALYEAPTLVFILMPEATPEWVAHVVERGLAHVAGLGIESVEVEADQVDDVLREVLFARGFAVKDDGLIECWLAADARREISPLDEDYRLFSRSETMHKPHHMVDPRRPTVEQRLLETSLYRSDLDLVVFDRDENVAGYGMFWFDPETATGVVEPMRTQDDHQQRGIARHILTSGIDRLAEAGAERISIGFEPDNPASGHLYLSVGFEAHRQTDLLAGPTSAPGS